MKETIRGVRAMVAEIMRPQSGKHKSRNRVRNERGSRSTLESLLALDAALVELSMHLYNVPGRERSVLRLQTRRLYRAVRRGKLTANRQCNCGTSQKLAKIA
jgi:hypothetical protein